MPEAVLFAVALLAAAVGGGTEGPPPSSEPLAAEETVVVAGGARLGTLRGARIAAATRGMEDSTLAVPWLAPGVRVGTLTLERPWRDARGAPLGAGSYALSYAVQPPRKEHAGTSPWRDFVILVPLVPGRSAAAVDPPFDGLHPLVLALRRDIDEGDAEGETRIAFAVEVVTAGRPPQRRALIVVVDPPAMGSGL